MLVVEVVEETEEDPYHPEHLVEGLELLVIYLTHSLILKGEDFSLLVVEEVAVCQLMVLDKMVDLALL
jgi:hypothetical protein